jgi:hypothetical protein
MTVEFRELLPEGVSKKSRPFGGGEVKVWEP